MKKQSIKAKLSSTILIIVLLTICIVSFLANYFINKQFTNYIARQQALKAQVIQSTLCEQYNQMTKKWNVDFIQAVGMYSLYEGYVIKVYDMDNKVLWDAQRHDMRLCSKIMGDISKRMNINYPRLQGKFTSNSYQLEQSGVNVGHVSISYFGPFFLSENEFQFLDNLNKILIGIGIISLVLSFIVGHMLARKLSDPILKTVEAAKQIADGKYEVRITEEADTKELDLLVTSINHLASRLETLEKLRKQLTADVAHELRTPITILQSHIEAMSEGIWEPTIERLDSCYEETLRIGKLVSDLENLAKIESSNLQLNKSEEDLNNLIEKVVKSFEGELNKKEQKVTIEGPDIKINVDADRIGQVVVNLLSNAIKYSKVGGRIDVELFETVSSSGFHIKDDGIGIPEDELPFIFERFYRADKSRNRATGGSGIGLTIVKSIIDAHGGKISVESRLNEGSLFTVSFPKKQRIK